MEIAIGNATYYVDRILFVVVMQICWTLVLSIGGIITGRKKDILIMATLSLVPITPLLALFGDFEGAFLFAASAAIGCGIAIKARNWVGPSFAAVSVGSVSLFVAGSAAFCLKTGNIRGFVLMLIVSAVAPVAMLADGVIRRRILNQPAPHRGSHSYEHDDGGSGFGESGSGFGRRGGSGDF